jgi:hypothetical protein
MSARREVLPIPPKSSVLAQLPLANLRAALTHSESTLVKMHQNKDFHLPWNQHLQKNRGEDRIMVNQFLPSITSQVTPPAHPSAPRHAFTLSLHSFPPNNTHHHLLSFHILAHSSASCKMLTPIVSCASALLLQNTRGGHPSPPTSLTFSTSSPPHFSPFSPQSEDRDKEKGAGVKARGYTGRDGRDTEQKRGRKGPRLRTEGRERHT